MKYTNMSTNACIEHACPRESYISQPCWWAQNTLCCYRINTQGLLSTLFTRPTAKKWPSCRMQNLPRVGKSENASSVRGWRGLILQNMTSPAFITLGFSSTTLPERRSIFCRNASKQHRTCAVQMSRWNSKPGITFSGAFMRMTCAMKDTATCAGSFLVSETMTPAPISCTTTHVLRLVSGLRKNAYGSNILQNKRSFLSRHNV